MPSLELVLIALAVVLLIAGRIWARRWIRSRWLDDRLTNHQAAVLFWLVAIAPLLLIGAVTILNNPGSAWILVPLLAFVMLPMMTLMVAVTDYMATRGVKERLQAERQEKPAHPRPYD